MDDLMANGYIIHDFLCIRVQALHEGNLDMVVVSELIALGNDIDVI
jgi:hypothetical protein